MSYLDEMKASANRFFKQKSREYLYFQLVFGAIALHAFVTGSACLLSPESALEPFLWLGVMLGGREYPVTEQSHVWRALAGTQTLTLGFLCVFLQFDVKRRWVVLWPLVFMKVVSAAAFLGVYFFANRFPAFWGMALRDAVFCGLLLYFADGARSAAEKDESILVPRPLGHRGE
ncbi:MAG: hypothetical protein HZB91_09235 [Elusimicrobia bacterium]|nr:hypothetical protein [Elusimicrobiota bacterium]